MHAGSFRTALPLRARERERHAAGAHTRHARRPLPRLLQRRARREARRLVNSQPPLARKLSAHSSSKARDPAETRSSCLRAAIAKTSDLIGGIPIPFLELSVASSQPPASTYVVASIYDHSDYCDACSDRELPASFSARRRLPGHVRRERDLDTLCRGSGAPRNFAPASVCLLFGH